MVLRRIHRLLPGCGKLLAGRRWCECSWSGVSPPLFMLFSLRHFNRSSGVRLRISYQNPNTRAIQMPNGRAIILQNIPGARPGKLARYDQLPLIGLLGSSTLQAPLPTPRRGRIRRLKFALATLRRSLQASCALQDPCGISTFRSLYMGARF